MHTSLIREPHQGVAKISKPPHVSTFIHWASIIYFPYLAWFAVILSACVEDNIIASLFSELILQSVDIHYSGPQQNIYEGLCAPAVSTAILRSTAFIYQRLDVCIAQSRDHFLDDDVLQDKWP